MLLSRAYKLLNDLSLLNTLTDEVEGSVNVCCIYEILDSSLV